jgi:hypothetical protein
LISKARNAYRREGIKYLTTAGANYFLTLSRDCILSLYYRKIRSNRVFEFQGKTYSYFYSLYGGTWRTERSVEIPIIWHYVQNAYMKNKRVLEIGNVLSYRYRIMHEVLDKYEKGINVINDDVVSFGTDVKYDLIVSISTLEHVGWDEDPRDPHKILNSINNLKSLLVQGGELVVTLPLGQNLSMDRMIKEGILRFDLLLYLQRYGKGNDWIEVKYIDPSKVNYDYKTPRANAIIIGIIKA